MEPSTLQNGTYEELKKLIDEGSTDELESFRSSLKWIEKRFKLETGEHWEQEFKKYCLEHIPLFKSADRSNFDESGFEEKKIIKHLENISSEQTNQFWRKNSADFIRLLSIYRKDGSKDRNITAQLLNFSKNINNDPLRYIYEIIQNADDCEYEESPEITIDLTSGNEILVHYNEVGMTYADIIALTTVGQSSKKNRVKKRLIGEKGIGFKTIFSVCEKVEVHSGGYHFRLNDSDFIPDVIDSDGSMNGTKLLLKIKDNEEHSFKENGASIYQALKNKYGITEPFDGNAAFKNCPILFTNQLGSITVKNAAEEFTISRDGDYTISYKLNGQDLYEIQCIQVEEMIEFDYEAFSSRYTDQFENEKDFEKVIKNNKSVVQYPIILVAPRDSKKISKGNLYSYLPTYTNIKAPFSIHLPLKLNLDRSGMWFDGDQDTNNTLQATANRNGIATIKWNEILIEGMFTLITKFYQELHRMGMNLFDYIPGFNETNHRLFESEKKYEENIDNLNKYCSVSDFFKKIPYFKKVDGSGFCSHEEAIMFDAFIHQNFYQAYYEQVKNEKPEKYFVEYEPGAFEKMKWCGFKVFEVQEELKATYLNNIATGKEQAILAECLKEENRSEYIPLNMKQLKILPVLNKNRIRRYECYEGNYWFEPSEVFTSNGQICFIEKVDANTGLFKELVLMESTDIKSVIKNMLEKCGIEATWDKALFEELLGMIAAEEGGEEPLEYLELRLHSHLKSEVEKDDLYNLVKVIKFNTRKGNWLIKSNQTLDMQYYTFCVLTQEEKDEAIHIPPVVYWDERFCQALNAMPFDESYRFNFKDLTVKKCQTLSIIDTFNAYEHLCKVENIYIYQELPTDYVHFTNTVILKSCDEKVAENCSESIRTGVSLIKQFKEVTQQILKDKETLTSKDESSKKCEKIKQICALGAHFSPHKARRILEEDHDVLNELLQNANDRIQSETRRSCLDIELNGNKLILKYEEEGFSAKDFLSIATSGNSGNIDNSEERKDNLIATGYKGTGFKSVYNVFNKVEISTGYVKCILDDTVKSTCNFTKSLEDFTIERLPFEQNEEKRHFPVPEFEYLDLKQNKTRFEFTFKSEEHKNQFIRQNGLTLEDNFIATKKFLFLDNIKNIKCSLEGESWEFDKEAYMEQYFYKESGYLEIAEKELKLNERFKSQEIPREKCKVTFLFPKEEKILEDTVNIYCTLPVQEASVQEFPFYINIPLLDLDDGRNVVKKNKWNDMLVHKIFSQINSLLKKAFENLAQTILKDSEADLQQLLAYFPFKKIETWGVLKDVKFIPVWHSHNRSIELKTINELLKTPLLLEKYLNEWIVANRKVNSNLMGHFPINEYVYYGSVEAVECLANGVKYWNKGCEYESSFKSYFEKLYYENNLLHSDAAMPRDFLKGSLSEKYKYDQEFLYKCYLGKENCEKDIFFANDLNRFDEIDLTSFENFKQYWDEVNEFFAGTTVNTHDEKQLKQCFTNLREHLYINAQKEIVDTDDVFLEKVLARTKSEDLKRYWRELETRLANTADLAKIKALFQNQKIVVRFGAKNEGAEYTFLKLENLEGYYTSTIIADKSYVVCEPQWIQYTNILKNLDNLVEDAVFYEQDHPRILEIAAAYIEQEQYAHTVGKAIENYMSQKAVNVEANSTALKLFELLCEKSNEARSFLWQMKYTPLLKSYRKYPYVKEKRITLNTKVSFEFLENSLQCLSLYLKERFEDKVSEETQNTIFELELDGEVYGKKMSDYLADTYIVKDSNSQKDYCIGTVNGRLCILLFSEFAFGKMLRELFNCAEYQELRELVPMNCKLPRPLFKAHFDRFADMQVDFTPYYEAFKTTAKEDQIKFLIHRFEIELSGTWYCFAGYGGDKSDSKKCPVCKGILYAEASSLRLRTVQILQGIHVPILLCGNCQEALRYAEHYFICVDHERLEKIQKNDYCSIQELKTKLRSEEPLVICLDMYANEKKSQSLNLTFAHRQLILSILENNNY